MRLRGARFKITMSAKTTRTDNDDVEQILAEARQLRARRGNVYRDQALKILPWICAWCGREFTSKKLHELTVHHKDHNHNNNPPDGSNWELLCMYCHDSEHSRSLDRAARPRCITRKIVRRPTILSPISKSWLRIKNSRGLLCSVRSSETCRIAKSIAFSISAVVEQLQRGNRTKLTHWQIVNWY